MKRSALLLATLVVMALGGATASAQARAESRAVSILDEAGSQLRDAKGFSFRADVLSDVVVATGQKLQRGSRLAVLVRRPDGLVIDNLADRFHRKIWYDGKSLTVFDVEQKLFAAFDAPRTIDETVRLAMDRFNLSLPLADLLLSRPAEGLRENIASASYLGLHRVGEVPCHHLAFTQDAVDWQIWIEDGNTPLPRKIVLTMKNLPGSPQVIALISDWNLQPDLDDVVFAFTPPDGAQKIEFMEQ